MTMAGAESNKIKLKRQRPVPKPRTSLLHLVQRTRPVSEYVSDEENKEKGVVVQNKETDPQENVSFGGTQILKRNNSYEFANDDTSGDSDHDTVRNITELETGKSNIKTKVAIDRDKSLDKSNESDAQTEVLDSRSESPSGSVPFTGSSLSQRHTGNVPIRDSEEQVEENEEKPVIPKRKAPPIPKKRPVPALRCTHENSDQIPKQKAPAPPPESPLLASPEILSKQNNKLRMSKRSKEESMDPQEYLLPLEEGTAKPDLQSSPGDDETTSPDDIKLPIRKEPKRTSFNGLLSSVKDTISHLSSSTTRRPRGRSGDRPTTFYYNVIELEDIAKAMEINKRLAARSRSQLPPSGKLQTSRSSSSISKHQSQNKHVSSKDGVRHKPHYKNVSSPSDARAIKSYPPCSNENLNSEQRIKHGPSFAHANQQVYPDTGKPKPSPERYVKRTNHPNVSHVNQEDINHKQAVLDHKTSHPPVLQPPLTKVDNLTTNPPINASVSRTAEKDTNASCMEKPPSQKDTNSITDHMQTTDPIPPPRTKRRSKAYLTKSKETDV